MTNDELKIIKQIRDRAFKMYPEGFNEVQLVKAAVEVFPEAPPKQIAKYAEMTWNALAEEDL